ncbi:hypothetical protein ACFYPN_32050 [Streptomyces sp. NPDC005576]|uniref:hypothetical protein n=1 Tax=unclassified Streptomyces TaxID=2593676 RepID=UPI0033C9A822
MGKTQNKRSAKQGKARKAAVSRNAAYVAALMADVRMRAMGDFAGMAPSPDDFTRTYETVGAAITAAEKADGALSFFSFDDVGEYERTLRQDAGSWRYEVTLYPGGELRDLVKASWLNADDRDQAVGQLCKALAEYVPADLRRPDIEVVRRPSTTEVPRIGWMQSLPVAGLKTWEDVWLVEKDLSLFDLAEVVDSTSGCAPPTKTVFASFREHGLTVRDCAGCGAAVTDRHPHWPGLWVSVECEFGPVCNRPRLDRKKSLQEVPHAVHADQVRRGVRLTGKEQKVQCRHCDARVTSQHPDWPGVWVEASKYSTPICAVLGHGAGSAQEYDLVDGVYPHVPVGETTPADAAIAAARKTGYFFQPRSLR